MFVVCPELEPDLRRLREEPELGNDRPAFVPDLAHRGNDLLDAYDPDEDHQLQDPDQEIADALRTVLDLHEAAASLGDGGGVIEALGCPAAAIHGRIAPRLGSLFIARFSCVLSGPRDLFYRAGFLSLWYDSMAFIIL